MWDSYFKRRRGPRFANRGPRPLNLRQTAYYAPYAVIKTPYSGDRISAVVGGRNDHPTANQGGAGIVGLVSTRTVGPGHRVTKRVDEAGARRGGFAVEYPRSRGKGAVAGGSGIYTGRR